MSRRRTVAFMGKGDAGEKVHRSRSFSRSRSSRPQNVSFGVAMRSGWAESPALSCTTFTPSRSSA